MNFHTPIPPARVSAMIELWGDGQTAAAIDQRIGMTRNAVLGKINRLRLKMGARQVTLDAATRFRTAADDIAKGLHE